MVVACAAMAAAIFSGVSRCDRGEGSDPVVRDTGQASQTDEIRSVDGGADARVPGGEVSDLSVCRERGRLSSARSTPLGAVATWEVSVPFEECAASIVSQYRDVGEVSLEHDGYIDLLGRVWGCVVAHPDDGWSEVVIVRDGGLNGWYGEDDGNDPTCTVVVVRLDGSSWRGSMA